jgi:GPH family glycoside/pentoside/hexuronide:cation symporter
MESKTGPSTVWRQRTAAKDRVPLDQLIAYGMGGLIPIALFNIAGQLMGLLGNISLGLSAFWLGTIMIIPRLWDGIADPVMGYISDNTRTRWGRRRPYILLGGITTALSFVVMWSVPRGEWIRDLFATENAYNWFQLTYILAGVLLFYTSTTIFEIPHGALGLEMSGDYHERTRLFSANSFLGNLFAMGTPWLIFLAGLETIHGPGGDLIDGMQKLSLILAVVLIPLSVWWFLALKEPRFEIAKTEPKSAFWQDIQTTVSNKTFLHLVAIIFTLAMGFNFVNIFSYYITIFYVYGGDAKTAGTLLGLNGSVWAITSLAAVVPLNLLSRWLGKNKTLTIAILFMCAAQLAKIECYDPERPRLMLIPTMLLSAGMLMFFTLGSSMVGDVCDEDELQTGTRNEGSYYSIYWWFIKVGSAFASFVMGALLVYTGFDERQNVTVDALQGNLALIESQAQKWAKTGTIPADRISTVDEQIGRALANHETVRRHLDERAQSDPDQSEYFAALIARTDAIRARVDALRERAANSASAPEEVVEEAQALFDETQLLKRQPPKTLFRLRLVEIGLPLLMSCISIVLTLSYPLTEERWREIKSALDKRHATTD